MVGRLPPQMSKDPLGKLGGVTCNEAKAKDLLHRKPGPLAVGPVCQGPGGSARSRGRPAGRPHTQSSPEATYSSRASPLLAALARGAQVDIFTLTRLLAGAGALGETGREQRHVWQTPRPAPGSESTACREPCWEPHRAARCGRERTETVRAGLPGRPAPGSESSAAWPAASRLRYRGPRSPLHLLQSARAVHPAVLGSRARLLSALVGTAGPRRGGR